MSDYVHEYGTDADGMSRLPIQARMSNLLHTECEEHGKLRYNCEECRERDELALRDQIRVEAIEEAETKVAERFPLRYRNAATDRSDVLDWVHQFEADPTTASSLLLLGPTGTGKTYLGYAAVRECARIVRRTRVGEYRGTRWQALTYADLCASLRPRGRDHDPEAVLEQYLRMELLFIDDLGAAKTTEFVEEATYRLINGRYNDMRPSIFTSNLALGELKDSIGDRIASRLAETCTRIVLDGPDRRRQPRAA